MGFFRTLEKSYETPCCVGVVTAVFLTINMIEVYDMCLLHRAFFATTVDTYTTVYDMFCRTVGFFSRVIIMRIRFRASDFGLVAKKKYSGV